MRRRKEETAQAQAWRPVGLEALAWRAYPEGPSPNCRPRPGGPALVALVWGPWPEGPGGTDGHNIPCTTGHRPSGTAAQKANSVHSSRPQILQHHGKGDSEGVVVDHFQDRGHLRTSDDVGADLHDAQLLPL